VTRGEHCKSGKTKGALGNNDGNLNRPGVAEEPKGLRNAHNLWGIVGRPYKCGVLGKYRETWKSWGSFGRIGEFLANLGRCWQP
jgi:hypothetical protein